MFTVLSRVLLKNVFSQSQVQCLQIQYKELFDELFMLGGVVGLNFVVVVLIFLRQDFSYSRLTLNSLLS